MNVWEIVQNVSLKTNKTKKYIGIKIHKHKIKSTEIIVIIIISVLLI